VKFLLILFLSVFYAISGSYAQSTLFDESRVSSVYIEIDEDSLDVIMTDVLSDHYFQALFIYDYGTGRDTLQNVGFRLRGNTSRYSQKKSFKISFNEYVSGREYQGVKKINLNGQHNDPTMVREKLFYDSWKNAGMAERRTSFVRMYINHEYYGLYTNLEEFDKDWLQKIYGEKSGNLYKCTYPADLVYLGPDQQVYKDIQSGSSTGGRAYDLQTNEAEDDYSDLVNLMAVLNNPADSVFEAQIAQKINVDGFLKAFALDVATGNWDDYMYNMNNFFLYHRTDNDKFEFISYDADNTFGVDWVNQDWTTRDCIQWYNQDEPRPLASKILSVPAFMSKYQRYLDTITREIIWENTIFPHIDSLRNLITNAAIEDEYRILDFGYTVNDFFNGFTSTIDGHTPYGIKPFLTKRYTTILEQLAANSVPEIENSTSTLLIYPNPVESLLTLKVLSVASDRQILIFDMLGTRKRSILLPENSADIVIQVADLKPGVYIVNIYGNGKIISKRFIKK
jgi:hypothetical protein